MFLLTQYEDGKLDDLLKEVAATDVTPGVPKAPPVTDEPESTDDSTMLPSQRNKRKYCCAWVNKLETLCAIEQNCP